MRSLDERRLLEEKYGGIESPVFFSDCERLRHGEPLAYVIGWQPFLGLKIRLDSRPLIPRPETEWWTEQLLQKTSRDPIDFLDLCAGSGAIGCAALQQLPQAKVYFGEIDPVHEATIRKNIQMNALDESRVHICIGDLFGPFAGKTFDLIAANPPYVPSERTLDASVRDFEPHQALFAGSDGLDIMRRIASGLRFHLTKNGRAWIECDNSHISEAQSLFAQQGFSTSIRTDQYGEPRVLVVSFP